MCQYVCQYVSATPSDFVTHVTELHEASCYTSCERERYTHVKERDIEVSLQQPLTHDATTRDIQVSLEKSRKLVSSFNDTATAGTTLVRQAGEAKTNEIKAHMAKIRQILDQVYKSPHRPYICV